MSDKLNGGLTLDELRELKKDITADLDTRLKGFEKVLDTGITAIKEMLQNFISSNDKAHDELKADAKELRNSIKEVYLRMNTEKDETDKKISAVRNSVEQKIEIVSDDVDNLKLAPGEKASKLVGKVGGYVLILFVGMAIYALINAISKGEVPIP